MIIVLVIVVWISLVSVVAGLCAAARLGDRDVSASALWEPQRPVASELADLAELPLRAGALAERHTAGTAASLRSDGVAA